MPYLLRSTASLLGVDRHVPGLHVPHGASARGRIFACFRCDDSSRLRFPRGLLALRAPLPPPRRARGATARPRAGHAAPQDAGDALSGMSARGPRALPPRRAVAGRVSSDELLPGDLIRSRGGARRRSSADSPIDVDRRRAEDIRKRADARRSSRRRQRRLPRARLSRAALRLRARPGLRGPNEATRHRRVDAADEGRPGRGGGPRAGLRAACGSCVATLFSGTARVLMPGDGPHAPPDGGAVARPADGL